MVHIAEKKTHSRRRRDVFFGPHTDRIDIHPGKSTAREDERLLDAGGASEVVRSRPVDLKQIRKYSLVLSRNTHSTETFQRRFCRMI